MQHRLLNCLIVAAAASALACATQPKPVVVTTTTSSGDVVVSRSTGMWVDSVGGSWMDSTGAMYGTRGGMPMGLGSADFAAMTDANIVAHLWTGDSLEVALSQAGASRAQNPAVRDFAQRMVTEHTRHMQTAQQMAAQASISPTLLPADTLNAQMAMRMMDRLSNVPPGADYDRQLMRAEVMMHRHMLHELQAVQPHATGVARQLVDETIPVVQQHLADAQPIWHQVGGGMNAMNP